MVIISHPLSRLVNSWHHKFHKLGIEHEQGLKLIRFVFSFKTSHHARNEFDKNSTENF